MTNLPVAIIGARGFIGAALSRSLDAAGYRISTFTRTDGWIETDGSLTQALAEARTIIYLANSINPGIAHQDPGRAQEDLSTLRAFVEALGRDRGSRRVILPSSGGTVYDTTIPPPYTERSAVGPRSAYGAVKLEMEKTLANSAASGTELSIVRFSNVYGPGQPVGTGQGVIANWLNAAQLGNDVVMFGPDTVTRDFLYIDDAVDAIRLLVEAPDPPPLVNIGSGRPTTLGELIHTVTEVVGADHFRVRRLPARAFDVPHNYLSIDLALDVLGWKPQISLREGIARTWRWCEDTRMQD